jgi:hypothetical protein
MFVIGVGSQAQHGKDTLADRLCLKLNEAGGSWTAKSLDTLGVTWQRGAFAAAVKKVFCDTFGADMDFIEKWKVIPECPPGFEMPVRAALQFIGDGFRKIKSTVWLDIAFRDKAKPKVISDVRYVNEFVRVKTEGGLNILVARPDKINDDPNGSEAQIRPYIEFALKNLHEGRVGPQLAKIGMVEAMGGGVQVAPPPHMECFDYFIINNGTKEEFFDKIDKLLVPYAQQFPFEFPVETGQEGRCLISA